MKNQPLWTYNLHGLSTQEMMIFVSGLPGS